MAQQISFQAYQGPLTLDLTKQKVILVDVPDGGTQHMLREQEGMDDVNHELAATTPEVRAAAGIPEETFVLLMTCTDNLAEIRAQRAVADKIAEILAESEAKLEHDRETATSILSDAVRSTARRTRDASVAAPFEKTVKYVSQTGVKAARARKKNKEAKAAPEAHG